ncbi:MAG: SH3 domain-containing protein, partial [Anaerolineae bacterium]|nr:SH3 domain-containing protein [Anaerolineae bacterium]
VNNPGSISVNLRSGPGTDFPPVAGLPNGTIMAALGRDATSRWLYVENARYAGWIFANLTTLNADPLSLPLRTN